MRGNLKLPAWLCKLFWVALKPSWESRAKHQVPRIQSSSHMENWLTFWEWCFELGRMKVEAVSPECDLNLIIVLLAGFCLRYWEYKCAGHMFVFLVSSVIPIASLACLTHLQKTRILGASLGSPKNVSSASCSWIHVGTVYFLLLIYRAFFLIRLLTGSLGTTYTSLSLQTWCITLLSIPFFSVSCNIFIITLLPIHGTHTKVHTHNRKWIWLWTKWVIPVVPYDKNTQLFPYDKISIFCKLSFLFWIRFLYL